MLVGAGGSISANETGGNSTHTLTTNEMPRHQHAITLLQSGSNSGSLTSVSAGNGQGSSRAVNTDWQGGGAAFSLMQPYLGCYIWQRIA
ncbi:baseplate structural protein Gp10 [Bifidobacterium sp. DSM 109957]|uniref:Baseplate structural protein Gp10 n=1 Tax=Bifidobacterium oedipodis TaxID=2675322 RepID=A0A7Y0HTM8_9BIFI|nr:baseplate structural protein Gp10 [Bifidobacterium sp. DSM 109957]